MQNQWRVNAQNDLPRGFCVLHIFLKCISNFNKLWESALCQTPNHEILLISYTSPFSAALVSRGRARGWESKNGLNSIGPDAGGLGRIPYLKHTSPQTFPPALLLQRRWAAAPTAPSSALKPKQLGKDQAASLTTSWSCAQGRKPRTKGCLNKGCRCFSTKGRRRRKDLYDRKLLVWLLPPNLHLTLSSNPQISFPLVSPLCSIRLFFF